MSTTDAALPPRPERDREPPSSPTLTPVARGERIDFLDTARGFALLGILFVNIQSFGGPFGKFIEFKPQPGLTNHILFYFTKVFCEGKFYTLFSLLFGIGLAIQWSRAHRAKRAFAWIGVRRMLFLMALGLCHGLLLWYGDILLTYSICGLLLLLVLGFRASTLAAIAAVIIAVATLLTAGMSALMDPNAMQQARSNPAVAATTADPAAAPLAPATPSPSPDIPAAVPMDPAQPAADNDLKKELSDSRIGRLFDTGGPSGAVWIEEETHAMKHGPWADAFLFRVLQVGMILIFTLLGFGWGIMGMFLAGAALWKSGLVARPGERMFRLFLWLLPVGLCGSALATWLVHSGTGGMLGRAGAGFLALPSAVLVALGYFSLMKTWVESGRGRGFARLLGNVGRFGLTNYIMQTVICTFVFYHWGLAQFGEFSRVERFVLVIGVYAFQVILSAMLTRWLAFGPLEWVWRSVTYLKPQPLLKRPGAAAAD